MSLAEALPKIHLHCHLEGSMRAATFVDLAAKYGVALRYRPARPDAPVAEEAPVDPNDPYRFTSFLDFLYGFAAVNRSLQRPEDYARLAREFVEDALAQRVVYGELFVSPSVWRFFNPQINEREIFEAIASELRKAAPQAAFKLIVDLTRNFGEESAMRTARLATELTDLDVIGIGLGGDETRFPPELFEAPFAFARAHGLRTVAHAGEAAGAHSVRGALDALGAERIGHGIAALQDGELVERLAAEGVALEVCPTSNRLTGAALQDGHAFEVFDRAGCVVVIDADDPTMFGTSIAQEYAYVERECGAQLLARFARNAVDASFAEPALKQRLRLQLESELERLHRNENEHVGA